MSVRFLITHFYHSGFSVSCEDVLLVFDYWRGEEGELGPGRGLSDDTIRSFRKVVVFISHEHPDHLDPVVFTWRELTDVTYVVSSDMPVGTRGRRMAPGDTLDIEDGLSIKAFDSTDLGVSFLVSFRGCSFFHAGDLNFWHWREESTIQEIDEADQEFRKAVEPIGREQIDVAFFPVDPRQGTMFEAGANYFILTVKPRLLIPMHYFHRSDVATEYARTAGNRFTEVMAMPGICESVELELDDDGYINIFAPQDETPAEEEPEEEIAEDVLSGDNPFSDSDLPLSQLAMDEDNSSDE